MSFLGVVYLIAALLVALYGGNALLLSVLYLRHRSDRPDQPADPDPWPVVTVQLPIYNELHVVKRLIDAVARLDYPRDRLQIQVLDDSTDETTQLALKTVAIHRGQGLDIELVYRTERAGFKAGALARGLETARGEFVAIFDADFVPRTDFLKRAVPYLVADQRVGFVQARWGYLNASYSALTQAQTIALDGQFVVEHLGRNRSGLLMNFNGTAGIWRREAIDSAGGWQGDTLTEDMDLSFRAQLAGWQALYLPDVDVPAELPPQMAAFKRQQARWSTGGAQCLVKLGRPLLRGELSPKDGSPARETGQRAGLSWPVRLEGLVRLSLWMAYPISLILLFLTPLMLLGRIPVMFNLTVLWLVALGRFVAYALSQRALYPDWKRRMRYMPVLALAGVGLALSNTLAIGKGLLGREMPFRRTPKFRIERQGDRWIGSNYVLPFDWVTVGELVLAGYALFTIGVALYVGNYLAVPFLFLYAIGYSYVGLHSVRDAFLGWQRRPRLNRAPAVADSQIK